MAGAHDGPVPVYPEMPSSKLLKIDRSMSELRLCQDPKRQAALMASKWPACNVAVIMPSRVEGCYSCFDHFLGRTTASGEPLGFSAGVRLAHLHTCTLSISHLLCMRCGVALCGTRSCDAVHLSLSLTLMACGGMAGTVA